MIINIECNKVSCYSPDTGCRLPSTASEVQEEVLAFLLLNLCIDLNSHKN